MFSLVKESVRLVNVNLRKERHGDEKVLAVDLKFEAKMHNSVLLKFSETLRDDWYMKDPGAQEDLINPDHLPKLKHPEAHANANKWALEMRNVRFSVYEDGTNDEDIIFTGCKASNFTLQGQEGGTVVVGFRVQAAAPTKEEVAELAFLIDEILKVNLEVIEEDEKDKPNDGERPDNVVGLFDRTGDGEREGDPDVNDAGFTQEGQIENQPAQMSVE